ncbi:MAG: phosphopentomutase [Endomicrobium sp.]|jgi:phosphopentomutase|nr:phosphopentomutase [Endomicrobium sp.]
MPKRVILIVLDSVGVGELPNAAVYRDEGANTMGHIFDSMGDSFFLPNMAELGLYKLLNDKKKSFFDVNINGCFGKMATKSLAKDTTAGHWEIAGIVLSEPFPVYQDGFPKEIIEEFEKQIGIKIIGNYSASGTEIIKQLGLEHQKTGCPIVYDSADSVFQIAAHEETFGLNRLYEICKIARSILRDKNAVGRVIARPFTGANGIYTRTINRRDYSLTPFENTILDEIKNSNGNVTAIGKVEDIFNSEGIINSIHTKDNLSGMQATLNEVKQYFDKQTLIFTNLVDFDMLWGHRRNVSAYAEGLKDFDGFLPILIKELKDDDILIITADHGCDPSYKFHTDHTREYVPLLLYGKKLKKNVNLGVRDTLSDIAQTIADIFKLSVMKNGLSFKNLII